MGLDLNSIVSLSKPVPLPVNGVHVWASLKSEGGVNVWSVLCGRQAEGLGPSSVNRHDTHKTGCEEPPA